MSVALVVTAAPTSAASTDNRPIFYTMLRGLESQFERHAAARERELETWLEQAAARRASRLAALESEREALEEALAHSRGDLDARRAHLDAQVAALNERVRALDAQASARRRLVAQHEAAFERGDELMAHEQAISTALETLRGWRSTLRGRIGEVDATRAELNALGDAFRSGTHPLARQIARVDAIYRTWSRARGAELEREVRAYERERQGFTAWRQAERRALGLLENGLEQHYRDYDEIRARHDALAESLAELVDRYNATLAQRQDSSGDDARESPMTAVDPSVAELAARIARDEAELGELRARALELADAMQETSATLERQRTRFEAERGQRQRALAGERARIETLQATTQAAIAERRARAQQSVQALETVVREALLSLRDRFDATRARIVLDYGARADALDAALGDWLTSRSRQGLLEEGQPRFDTTLAEVATVYATVETVETHEREVLAIVARVEETRAALEGADKAMAERYAALEAARNETLARIADLEARQLERRQAHEQDIAAWRERVEAMRAEHDAQRQAHRALYETHLALAAAELEELQSLMLGAVRGAEPPQPSRERTRLAATVPTAADATDGSLPSLRARTPLTDHFVAVGESAPATNTVSGVVDDEVLRRVRLWRWADRLARGAVFAPLLEGLAAARPDATPERLRDFVRGLFVEGMAEHCAMTTRRTASGVEEIEVRILDRAYRVNGDGELERLARQPSSSGDTALAPRALAAGQKS
ncbi:MAG: hypothetical protein H6983_03730 [Ectothiorhodospiraceae bacterium]|nr:hypothetical protein [Ectothiorhodospiraceae bacterium]